jgi:recombination associated protein RdgC
MSAFKSFTNVIPFRFTQNINFGGPVEFSSQLAEHCAKPLGPQQLSTMGFITPFGVAKQYAELIEYTLAPHRTFYISAQKTERLLPAKVVRQAVDAKIREIEKDQDRKVYSKERNQIKDEIVISMLPRAFQTSSRINALICYPYIFVEATSSKKAEELLSLLREALGSLPVRPVTAKMSPVTMMTDWMKHGTPLPFFKGEAFQSRATSQESSTLSGKNVDLSEDDIRELFETDREVTQLQMSFVSDNGSTDIGSTLFTLTDGLTLKGIQWPDQFSEKLQDDLGEDEDQINVARASLLLISNGLKQLNSELLEALGGEELGQSVSEPAEEEELV